MRNRDRVLLTATLLLLAARPAAAQLGRSFGGISGGPTYGDLAGPNLNTGSRWGFTAGLFSGYRMTGSTFVMLEGNWIQKGGAGTRLNYIELPLTAGVVFPSFRSALRLRIYTGIGVGFRVGCDSGTAVFDCDLAKSPEWAWPVGATAVFRNAGGFIGLDARYSHGLSNAFSTLPAENRSWQFRLYLGKPVG